MAITGNNDSGLSTPIQSFITYFNDIKPYHTKILEVLEQYNFKDPDILDDNGLSIGVQLYVGFSESLITEWITPTPTISITPTQSPTQTAEVTPTPSSTSAVTPTPASTVGATPTPTAAVTVTPAGTPAPGVSQTPQATVTMTPIAGATPSPTAEVTPSNTADVTPPPTPGITLPPTPSPTATLTLTPTPTPTADVTVTPSITPSPTLDAPLGGGSYNLRGVGYQRVNISSPINFNSNGTITTPTSTFIRRWASSMPPLWKNGPFNPTDYWFLATITSQSYVAGFRSGPFGIWTQMPASGNITYENHCIYDNSNGAGEAETTFTLQVALYAGGPPVDGCTIWLTSTSVQANPPPSPP